MPYEGPLTMTRLEKLQRLYDLLDGMTNRDQLDFKTCLWPRAMEDAVLRAAGLTPPPPHHEGPYGFPGGPGSLKALQFLGLPHNSMIFGSYAVVQKRSWLKTEMAKEEKQATQQYQLALV